VSVIDSHWLFWFASPSASQQVWSSAHVWPVPPLLEPLEPLELDVAHAGDSQPELSVQLATFCRQVMQVCSGDGHFWRHAASPQSHAWTQVMYEPQAPPKVPLW
jgi:hypothetical protein